MSSENRVDTSRGPRWISRQPTPEIANLNSQIRDFCHRGNFYVCNLAPINFIGSLLVLTADRKRDPMATTFHAKNVPLLLEEENRDNGLKFQALGINLPDVLIKNACGRTETGVVLNGPLAGLIVDSHYTDKPFSEGMIANRVWNDDKLDYYIDTDGNPGFVGKYNNAFMMGGDRNRLVELFRKLVLKDKTLAWTTDLFFRLCHQNGFPVNESQFHYTRSLPDISNL